MHRAEVDAASGGRARTNRGAVHAPSPVACAAATVSRMGHAKRDLNQRTLARMGESGLSAVNHRSPVRKHPADADVNSEACNLTETGAGTKIEWRWWQPHCLT